MDQQPKKRPLVLLLPWLHAKQRYVKKFCVLYDNLGFDVLVANTAALDVMVPKTGANVIANDVVQFLSNNQAYEKIVVHGFSVGGYIWGEILANLHENKKRDLISNRIKGQIWDSVTGLNECKIGVSQSLFPEHPKMQKFSMICLNLYLKSFHDKVTKHHIQAGDYFRTQPVPAPALIFASKVDPIGTERQSLEIVSIFRKQNVDATFMCFEDSPHVQHYHKHKKEYMRLLREHLEKCGLIVGSSSLKKEARPAA